MKFRSDLSWAFRSADEIEARTLRALRNHIAHVKDISPFYRSRLADVDPAGIASLDEYASMVPCTEKTEIVEQTAALTAASPDEVVETVVTSGSTGKPLVFSMTSSDLDRLAYNEALSFSGMGVTAADRAQILVSLDRLFIAGMAYYRGLTLLGANTARIGVLPLEMQQHYLELLRPTVIVGVPSFLRKLAQELQERGFDTRAAGIRAIACIGESIRTQDMQLNAVGTQLEELYNAKAYSTYGNTELSVAYCECTAQNGGHAHPELAYTEILGDDGKPVPDGTPGEMVVTPLGVEGVPLVRYRTGDITFRLTEPCSCGRNSCRIGPILARRSQMIKLKGTTVYPLTLTNALDELDGVRDYVLVLEGDDSLSDRVALHVVAPPAMVVPIANHLRACARVSFPVLVSNEASLNAMRGSARKKTRIIDLRRSRA
ncbi:MAG: AMP-binding protein [Chitinivibrionales bacterium]|nr:AMP-binding protein [Chitinivibrionales bacterium]